MESPCEEVYVAVGKDMVQGASTLHWTLHNKPAHSLVLLHVHLPIIAIPSPLGKIPVNQVCESVVEAHEEDEKRKLNNCMEFYLRICSQAKVKADALVVMRADVRRGIVEMVSELGITKLIMGTSSAAHAKSKRMMKRPGKAGYVLRYAINSCDISIVCKGRLLVVREGSVVDNENFSRMFTSQPNFQPDLAASIKTRENPSDERGFTLISPEDCTSVSSEVSSYIGSQQIDDDEAPESTSHSTAIESLESLSDEMDNVGREVESNAAATEPPPKLETNEAGVAEAMLSSKVEDEYCQKLRRRLKEVEEELQSMVCNRRSVTTQMTKLSYERHQAIQKLNLAEEKFAAVRMQNYFALKGKEEEIKELEDLLHSKSPQETPSSPFTNVELSQHSLEDVKRVVWCIIFIFIYCLIYYTMCSTKFQRV